MAIWDELIAVTFVESTSTPNTADIKFSNTTTDIGYAHAYYPGRTATETTQNDKISGSVWLNPASEKYWHYSPSTDLISRTFEGRMFPLTLAGLDRAMKALLR